MTCTAIRALEKSPPVPSTDADSHEVNAFLISAVDQAEPDATDAEDEAGAADAAVGGVSGDGADAGLEAAAAGLGAAGVRGPGGDLAVDRAGLLVADAGALLGALVTTVGGGDADVVHASLDAGAAGLGACGPGLPGRGAVDGAGTMGTSAVGSSGGVESS